MILCKYSRTGSAVFVPHLDMLRAVIMGIRRQGIKVAFSEGFNPHMQLYFNQPLPIGIESECEYFCVYSDENPMEVMEKLNVSLPSGLKILKAVSVKTNPNIANIMDSALYEVVFRENVNFLKDAEKIMQKESCVISYNFKGEIVSKDVRALILDINAKSESVLKLKLKCGNLNLRADRLVNHILNENNNNTNFDVVKKEMFTADGKNLDFLFE